MNRVLNRVLTQVVDHRLTLPQKRCWETLLFFAKPCLKTEYRFTVPLEAFIQHTKLPSCSIEDFKALLRSIINVPVEWSEKESDDIGIASLVAEVSINDDHLYWGYAPKIRELLLGEQIPPTNERTLIVRQR